MPQVASCLDVWERKNNNLASLGLLQCPGVLELYSPHLSDPLMALSVLSQMQPSPGRARGGGVGGWWTVCAEAERSRRGPTAKGKRCTKEPEGQPRHRPWGQRDSIGWNLDLFWAIPTPPPAPPHFTKSAAGPWGTLLTQQAFVWTDPLFLPQPLLGQGFNAHNKLFCLQMSVLQSGRVKSSLIQVQKKGETEATQFRSSDEVF